VYSRGKIRSLFQSYSVTWVDNDLLVVLVLGKVEPWVTLSIVVAPLVCEKECCVVEIKSVF
jgi:hypothetical protein